MSAALTLPAETVPVSAASPARAEASRTNGACSRGPVSNAGKCRSRQNSCKDGLTGKGVVLPPAAAAEVDRLEADFARSIQPRDEFEQALVRQMALGAWRANELSDRLIERDAEYNARKFANFDDDERLAAAELGKTLADDPEAVVARLRRSSAGCDWLIARWDVLANGLSRVDDERDNTPFCVWEEAELSLALDLLGCPAGDMRALEPWLGRLDVLRERVQAGDRDALAQLHRIIADERDDLDRKAQHLVDLVETPRLRRWQAGKDIDLETPEGLRLRRYEAAASRLFHTALTRLDRMRKERGEPTNHATPRPPSPAPAPAPEPRPPAAPARPSKPAPAPAAARPTNPAPGRPSPLDLEFSALLDSAAPVVDLWAGGRPASR